MKLHNKILVGAVALATASISANVYADSTQDLIDALITKGVLTENEGALLAKGRNAEKKNEGKVAFKNGFKLESPDGESNMKFSGRVQLDGRTFDNEANNDAADTYDIRRAYFGVSGTYNKYYGYKINASYDKGSSTKLDVAQFDLKYFKAAQLRFGQFKTPMSLEERTSSRFINFTERSYVNNNILTTAKQQGIMLFGTPTKGLNYGLAMVNGYGQNNDMSDSADDGFKYIAHVDADLATMNKWKNKVLHVGFNYATQDDADSSYYESAASYGKQGTLGKGHTFFQLDDTNVTKLDTSTWGLEFAGANGPFKVQAEYAKTKLDTNVASQDVNAYYLEAGWLISGESYADSYKSKSDGGKFDRIKPAQAFNPTNFTGGAWELMAGVSKFDASDVTATSAGYIRSASDTSEADSWRVGLKFIPDANTRILVNYINTDFDTAINSTTNKNEKAVNVRMQYDF